MCSARPGRYRAGSPTSSARGFHPRAGDQHGLRAGRSACQREPRPAAHDRRFPAAGRAFGELRGYRAARERGAGARALRGRPAAAPPRNAIAKLGVARYEHHRGDELHRSSTRRPISRRAEALLAEVLERFPELGHRAITRSACCRKYRRQFRGRASSPSSVASSSTRATCMPAAKSVPCSPAMGQPEKGLDMVPGRTIRLATPERCVIGILLSVRRRGGAGGSAHAPAAPRLAPTCQHLHAGLAARPGVARLGLHDHGRPNRNAAKYIAALKQAGPRWRGALRGPQIRPHPPPTAGPAATRILEGAAPGACGELIGIRLRKNRFAL